MKKEILFFVILLSYSLVSGLKCYQCLNIDKMVQLRPEIKLPKDYYYGPECVSGEGIPKKYLVDCNPLKQTLNGQIKQEKDFACLEAASNVTDGFFELHLFGRACLNLDSPVVTASTGDFPLAKCHSVTLTEILKIIEDLTGDNVSVPKGFNATFEACLCKDGDGCRGARMDESGHLVKNTSSTFRFTFFSFLITLLAINYMI